MQIIEIFLSQRAIILSIMAQSHPIQKFNLIFLLLNLYTKFHFSMGNLCKENEKKLQIIEIFTSPRAITLSKMVQLYPKQNLT
jgi:hypothetical protein